MIDIAGRDIIPAVTRYAGQVANTATAKLQFIKDADVTCEQDLVTRLSTLTGKAYSTLAALREADNRAKAAGSVEKIAEGFLEDVIPLMQSLRQTVDEMETLTATDYWPMPGYGELLFSV